MKQLFSLVLRVLYGIVETEIQVKWNHDSEKEEEKL